MSRLLLALALLLATPAIAAEPHPGTEGFIEKAAAEYGLEADQVRALLAGAEFKQSIVDAMRRPAEAKPWFEYRPIFLTDKRIDGGVAFWREHADAVARAAERFGVDPEVIVAIIGVETFYGRITGSYRVLDALATLGFYYPVDTGRDRSAFFSDELMQFFVLAGEEGLPIAEVTGSYAGAMGLGQFIPSSYRAYAVDFDGDGRRDLWSSTDDAIGSVANYLARHGWAAGEPVVSAVKANGSADAALVSKSYKPERPVAAFAEGGYVPVSEVSPQRDAALLALEEKDGESHWLVFDNFYVITRYNRSPLYAMAVWQLGEAIREAYEG